MNATERPYTLYGCEVSCFTAKVRVAMRYKRLFMEEKRAELPKILKRTGLACIPVVTTPEEEVWQDSSEIIDRLEARHPSPLLYPESPLIARSVDSHSASRAVLRSPSRHLASAIGSIPQS
ncbi:MAG: hypothetical protein GY910_09635 [bacterium]|nr:hypothetical protein [Deltaproteobacteria bacterium]MCP4905231.1 hypothetical protein [bacterium]